MNTAARIFGPLVEQGADNYNRQRDLPKLLAVWPREIDDQSIAGTEHIIARIKRVLNTYRVLAMTAHWSYDQNNHIALSAALKAEQKALAHLQNVQSLARVFHQAAE